MEASQGAGLQQCTEAPHGSRGEVPGYTCSFGNHGWLTIYWLAMIPISLATGWVNSVVYVSALSLWALVSGHWSAWQAARVEVNQAEEIRAHATEDLAGEVVERVIDRTNVESAPSP